MKFSVVIPTLNEEKYISGILDCLVSQSHKEFEVIVVDSPKTIDKTFEVASSFKKKLNLKVVVALKGGVSFQRNYGAKIAKNDYILFFDADTLIEPVFINKIDVFLTNNNIDFLNCWAMPISKKKRDKMMFWAFNQIVRESVKKINPIALGAFIAVKKSSFNKSGGFSTEVVYGEDSELAMRMYKRGYKFVLLKDPIIYFSVRRLNTTGRINFITLNIKAGLYYFFKGPIKNYNLFKYDMDGKMR